MADTNEARLPTAAYLELVAAPGQDQPADQLSARLQMLGHLPQPESTLNVGSQGLLLTFAHPTQTLTFARTLIGLTRRADWGLAPLRIGVHVATMARTSAAAPDATISGSSIDGAMRIASLAGPNQALATAQFQTVVVHLLKIGAGVLVPLGKRTTSSGKTLDVFEIAGPPPGSAAPLQPAPAPRPAEPVASAPAANSLSEENIAAIGQMLAAEVGPIAKVLLKNARAHLPDQNRFLVHLADAVPEPDRRRQFLAQATKFTG
jgi:hypothetical protein